MNPRVSRALAYTTLAAVIALLAGSLTSCGGNQNAQAKNPPNSAEEPVTVGVIRVGTRMLQRQLTLSSELVPFQRIDVYAKESGYVRKLDVDYGTRVKANQVMAVLEIPELEVQIRQDEAAIQNARDQATRVEHELGRVEAQQHVAQLQFDRLNSVAKSKPGLVAQQEVDDAQGKSLALEAQVDSAKANLQSAQSELVQTQARKEHDQVLFDYSKITAPFAGVVTQRYANLGTLLQAGTSSSTQAMPLVQLSQDDLFRLVIPVPESYVKYIRLGSTVDVQVPSLNRSFPGKVARFSVDVKEDTRTMHTEVDVQNPGRVLIPGMYAEATLTLERNDHAVSVPLQAIIHEADKATVYVVDSSNKIESRTVTLGIQTAADAEVISGLKQGELVLVSDRSSLKPGQQVHPQETQIQEYKTQ